MPRWLLKAAAQKALSFLPATHACNYLLQKHVTGSLALDTARLKLKIDYARRHLDIWTSVNRSSLDDISICELGTGWFPVLPIVFYLCGAAKIWTLDKAPLLRRANIVKTIQLLAALTQDPTFIKQLPCMPRDRFPQLLPISQRATHMSAPDLLAHFYIQALVQDARRADIQRGSIQFVLSNSVLQEIPKHILFDIFREFRRIASTDSTMIHYINMVEPFVGYDPTLTVYHFLQFSDAKWKCVNNSLHFHNRLRMPDYRNVHNSSRFRILLEDNEKGPDRELDAIPLAATFKRYAREDLQILRTLIVSRPCE